MGCCFPKYMKDPDNIFNEVCKVFLKLPNIKNVVHVTSTLIDICTCLCIFFFHSYKFIRVKERTSQQRNRRFFSKFNVDHDLPALQFFFIPMSQLIIICPISVR